MKTTKQNSPCVYKVSFTAVFSEEIDKTALSDAIFQTLKDNTRNLSMLHVESIKKSRKGEEDARMILKDYCEKNLPKTSEVAANP